MEAELTLKPDQTTSMKTVIFRSRHHYVNTRQAIIKMVLGLASLMLLSYLVAWLGAPLLSIDRLRAWVEPYGAAAPAAFIFVSVIANLCFIPVAPFTIAAVALFPWPTAIVVLLLSRNLTANVGFLIARRLKKDRKHHAQEEGPLMHELNARLRKAALPTIILFRALPLAPFSVVSYAAGASRVRWRDYALGCFIGMLPGPFLAAGVLAPIFSSRA